MTNPRQKKKTTSLWSQLAETPLRQDKYRRIVKTLVDVLQWDTQTTILMKHVQLFSKHAIIAVSDVFDHYFSICHVLLLLISVYYELLAHHAFDAIRHVQVSCCFVHDDNSL